MDCFCQACSKCATAQSIHFLRRLKSQSQSFQNSKKSWVQDNQSKECPPEHDQKNWKNSTICKDVKDLKMSKQKRSLLSNRRSKVSATDEHGSLILFEISDSKIVGPANQESICVSCGKETEFKMKNMREMGDRERMCFISNAFIVKNYMRAKQEFLGKGKEEERLREAKIQELTQHLEESQRKIQFLETILKDLGQQNAISIKQISPEIIIRDSFGILDRLIGLNCSNLFKSETGDLGALQENENNQIQGRKELNADTYIDTSTLEKRQILEQERQNKQTRKLNSLTLKETSARKVNYFATPPKRNPTKFLRKSGKTSDPESVTNVFTDSKQKYPFNMTRISKNPETGFFTSNKKTGASDEEDLQVYRYISSQKRVARVRRDVIDKNRKLYEEETDSIDEFGQDLQILSSLKKSKKNRSWKENNSHSNQFRDSKNQNMLSQNERNGQKYLTGELNFNHTFRVIDPNNKNNPDNNQNFRIENLGIMSKRNHRERNINSAIHLTKLTQFTRDLNGDKENFDPNQKQFVSKTNSNNTEPNISNLLSKSSNTRSDISARQTNPEANYSELIKTKSTVRPGKDHSNKLLTGTFHTNFEEKSDLNKITTWHQFNPQHRSSREVQQYNDQDKRFSPNSIENWNTLQHHTEYGKKGNRPEDHNLISNVMKPKKIRRRSYFGSLSIPKSSKFHLTRNSLTQAVSKTPKLEKQESHFGTPKENIFEPKRERSTWKNKENQHTSKLQNELKNPFDDFFSDEESQSRRSNSELRIVRNRKELLQLKEDYQLELSDLEIETGQNRIVINNNDNRVKTNMYRTEQILRNRNNQHKLMNRGFQMGLNVETIDRTRRFADLRDQKLKVISRHNNILIRESVDLRRSNRSKTLESK